MKEFLEKIKLFWETLPKEIRVGCYYAGAIALNDVAAFLLGTKPLDPTAVLKVFVANIILVFVAEIKPRIESRK
jgi:hypothetical protein